MPCHSLSPTVTAHQTLSQPAVLACHPLSSSIVYRVLLRQNPHNVDEWHKRVALFEGSPTQMVRTYTDAVKTVDTSRAVGTGY